MHTYFIYSNEMKQVKIGRAYNVERRLAALQIGSPAILELLGSVAGDHERKYHIRFGAFRAKGEWFHCDDVLLREIAHILCGPIRTTTQTQTPPVVSNAARKQWLAHWDGRTDVPQILLGDGLFRFEDAAKALDVHVNVVTNAAARGELVVRRYGRTRRLIKRDVLRLLVESIGIRTDLGFTNPQSAYTVDTC